jgi:S1-C subfamily serine protease
MKRLLFAVAALFVIAGIANAQKRSRSQKLPPEKKSLVEMITQARNAIVRIEVIFPDETKSFGTGFFINNDGVAATAFHVIHPPGKLQPPQQIRVELRIPTYQNQERQITVLAGWSGSTATEVAADQVHDIVILKLDHNVFPQIQPIKIPGAELIIKPSVCQLAPRHLQDGEPVFTSGYPLDLPILITTSGFIASSDPMLFNEQTFRVEDIYWADMHANPGNSGGPLFSFATGAVIGMVIQYRNAPVMFADQRGGPGYGVTKETDGSVTIRPIAFNSGISVIVPAKYLADLLTRNNIRHDISKRN